jgi:hypothetical protein
VIDVDLVYEMLISPEQRKDDDATWDRARRVAAQLAGVFLADGIANVIVDGDAPVAGLRVALNASYASAVERVHADPTRTFSRDLAFLAAHYAHHSADGELVLDTDVLTVDQAVDEVVRRIS